MQPHWQLGCGDRGMWLCTLQQYEIISGSYFLLLLDRDHILKNGLNGNFFFFWQESGVSFLSPALSLPISEDFMTDF